MLKKIFLISLIFLLQMPLIGVTESKTSPEIKAAFIRDGDLWTFIEGQQKRITTTGGVFNPQWSWDGQWLSYQVKSSTDQNEQFEIWAYNFDTGKQLQIFNNGFNPRWAPNRNIIAFQSGGVLNISDLNRFYNIALGVNSFTWLPNGKGILLSSSANVLPDGWTHPILFKKSLPESFKNVALFENVHQMFTVPKELKVGNVSVMSINADSFTYSPSQKWLSFIVSPTASMAMDSNAVCVIREDGGQFECLDEVINGVGKPKWAPSKDILAYIAGGGRIVFGFKNKTLKYKEMPTSSPITPKQYAELSFTWIENETIVTSRVEEKEWSNNFNEHPLPKLVRVNISTRKQKIISHPPTGYGDYDPQYVENMDKLVWYRAKTLTQQHRDLWIANPDGTSAKCWLENVSDITFYNGKYELK